MRRYLERLGGISTRAGLLSAALVLAAAGVAGADDPDYLAFNVGAFDVDDEDPTALAGLEYRSDCKLWIFKPFGGVLGNADGGAYAYAGVLVDIYWGRRIVTTLSFAPGAYHDGDGKDLGSVLEFRSQLEISYRFDDRSRLGLAINHMSNAGIGDDNPGVNNATVTYAMPLDRLFGR